MNNNSTLDNMEKICNLNYISDTLGGKKNLIREILEAFIIQVPEELKNLNEAIFRSDYPDIRRAAHTMKSSVSLISVMELMNLLEEIENLGNQAASISEISALNSKLNCICKKALDEIEKELDNYN